LERRIHSAYCKIEAIICGNRNQVPERAGCGRELRVELVRSCRPQATAPASPRYRTRVTAPSDADETSAQYFANTPVL
jgi:hypothetical protein